MRAACEHLLVQPRLGEDGADGLDMDLVPAMGGASHGKLRLAEPERVGRAALDQGNRL